MMNMLQPMPANEMDRIETLANLDLDYTTLGVNLENLSKLAAKVAGVEISMVNLIDTYTQWTVANYGLSVDQMAREDSVCQYTIVEQDCFEVKDLSADARFKDKSYVAGEPQLRYYYGIPLTADNGCNLGALCVMDKQSCMLSPEKAEMLNVIAEEIINRLKALKLVEALRGEVSEVNETQRRVAHDIRGPIGGIIGLARIISEQGDQNTMDEVLEFISLIYKSGSSILELADEILRIDKPFVSKDAKLGADEFNQIVLKEKLLKLYTPQAINKQVHFDVTASKHTQRIPFLKNKLLQIIGNLVSNAIKFTPLGGKVMVHLELIQAVKNPTLQITIQDSGIGMSADQVQQILNGIGETTPGTQGEQGYGFGLALVKHLVESLKGTMEIFSELGSGTRFFIQIPQVKAKGIQVSANQELALLTQ
jgi:signal transduction histidine kinase